MDLWSVKEKKLGKAEETGEKYLLVMELKK